MGILFTKQKVLRIYRLISEADAQRFCDGVIFFDINMMFEVIEGILRNEKRGRIQR